MVSHAPGWFDDISTQEVLNIEVGGKRREVYTDEGYFSSRATVESRTILQCLMGDLLEDGVSSQQRDDMMAMGTLVTTGPASRSAVEAHLDGLGIDDAIHLLRHRSGAEDRIFLALGETNGWTDFAFELTPDGQVVPWKSPGFAEQLKEGYWPEMPSAPATEDPAP